MERMTGESLYSRWLDLSTAEVADIMKQIAEIEKKIFDFDFPACGSLYHAKDIEGEMQIPIDRDFCIGPVSARQFWHDERSGMDIDRGPCIPFPFCPSVLFIQETWPLIINRALTTGLC